MNSSTRVYYPAFDKVRIIAASIVMLVHFDTGLWYPSARIAVDVFFALSGWLIGGILLKTSKESLPRFYFNRSIRIWIPYYIAFCFLITVSLMKDQITAKWYEFLVYKLTFVYNIFGATQLPEGKPMMPLGGTGNHFWSVNAEEQFYLLCPILLVLLPKLGKLPVTWLIISVISLYTGVYPAIALGVFASVLNFRYGEFHQHAWCKIACVCTLLFSIYGFYASSEPYLFSPYFSIATILLLAYKGKPSSFWKFLGGISYPLYLNHWMGIFGANAIFKFVGWSNDFIRILVGSIFAYIIASLLFRFIERPLLKNRNQLFNEKRAILVTVVSYSMIFVGCVLAIYYYR